MDNNSNQKVSEVVLLVHPFYSIVQDVVRQALLNSNPETDRYYKNRKMKNKYLFADKLTSTKEIL